MAHAVCIALYHAVVRAPLPIADWCFLDEREFRDQLRFLRTHCDVIPLADVEDRLASEDGERPAVALTFDDGFQNNYDIAFPILRAEGVPATIFVTTGLVGTEDTVWFCRLLRALERTRNHTLDWRVHRYDLTTGTTRREASRAIQAELKTLPQPRLLGELRDIVTALGDDPDAPIEADSPYRMLSLDAIAEMTASGLIDIGAHTHTHAILSLLQPLERHQEIATSVAGVREVTGRECRLFAYPNGRSVDYDQDAVRVLAGLGIRVGVTAIEGGNDRTTPLLELRRFGIGADLASEDFERLTRSLFSPSAPTLVSGIIIFLDGESFLRDAIDSVLAQTYPHWELLLVDDGSSDGSTAIAKQYAAEHPEKIRYLEHPGHENRGKSASRNLGLRHATGALIALLDHDDIWHPTKLEDQVAILETHPDAGMTYGRTRYWHSWTGEPADRERDGFTVLGVGPDSLVQPPDLLSLLLRDERTIASTCSVLVRRSLADRVGGFEDSFANIYDDLVFLAKLYLEAPVFVADGCWDSYRQHPANSMSTAFRTGQWHPRRPNPWRESFLTWLEEYVHSKGATDPAVLSALYEQLAPYRMPDTRTLREKYLDACFDAGLALVRGDDAGSLLDALDRLGDARLDPQAVAEQIFDAVPRATDHAPSRWLEIWPGPAERLGAFLDALEAKAGAPGLASRAVSIFQRLIDGTWWLRVAEGNHATLVHGPDDPDGVRVAITRADTSATYDIQLNRPHGRVVVNDPYVLTFRARADHPRTIGVGIAQSHPPWTNLGLYREVQLDTGWREFVVEWVAADNDENARIHFDLGRHAASVELSQVALGSPGGAGART